MRNYKASWEAKLTSWYLVNSLRREVVVSYYLRVEMQEAASSINRLFVYTL